MTKETVTIYAPCRDGNHNDCVARLDLADGERFPHLALICVCGCHETLHKREFRLTVEFTDEERDQFVESRMWRPEEEEDSISDAIISEVTSNLDSVGLRPTVERVR